MTERIRIGIVGDIGSHFLYLARWFFGEVSSVDCLSRSFIERADRPDGRPYERGEDSALITLEFTSGAYATVQSVRGVKVGESGPAAELPIPDDIWNGARRDNVHDRYRDIFRGPGAMIGDFVHAVRTRRPCDPDFAEGLRIQQLCDAADESAAASGVRLSV